MVDTTVEDALDPGNSSKNTLKLENTEKRDALIAIEKKYQAKWQDSGVFHADAPSTSDVPAGSISATELRKRNPRFYGNFAYPYMNGTLHAGHSFTASKVEYAAGFSRMQGRRVLFPLGFHCTGMPIKACADKLGDDVKTFGQNFEKFGLRAEPDSTSVLPPAPTQADTKEDITKFSSNKSKASAKTVKLKHQFQIMLALGIPKAEIHKFSHPAYWLKYFPPLCIQDLNNFGARIDWRRSFVTTDANPYYDAFVRWQMNRLKEFNKIQFGVRYTIYSPKDGQPCMDHDRTEGEGVAPQDYTAIKLKVKEWAPKAVELIRGKIPDTANVYFVAATLRPETMYGQTCCFVGPKIMYGVFKVSEAEYYIVTKRAAWNMAFQGKFFDSNNFPRSANELPAVVELPGLAVVGTLVSAPLSVHSAGVRVLPMDSVLPTKGTGVVTSVPSDSPDDFATVTELAKKAEYYGIKREWAELSISPIIETPTYGNLTAPRLVEMMKINSPKDAKQLAEAKDLAYKEGYYKGTMLMGDFKGQSVESAKPKVKEALLSSGDALEYAEPNGHVVSRSGDECVVAYLGQWFLNYGENDPEWRQQVIDYVGGDFETYSSEAKNGFERNLDWLNRWACARTYGLGSKLPWDPKFLVESLSDSTIYMAYYTISHFLHSDIFGSQKGTLKIEVDQMTDDVWDYIFCRAEISEKLVNESGITQANLQTMRREFEYWYPLDMRVSGKDLIGNHLTFSLYIHAALFPREYWPRSFRCNGHLLLNGEKMSKSTGNFLTLNDAVKKYGADATRVALADAGDGIEDANFEETVANQVILRLYTLKEWCEEVVKDQSLRAGKAESFWDELFVNEMNGLVHEAYKHYDDTNYKLALKSALYDFTGTRDFYREATAAAGIGMNRSLVLQYVELQALLLTPIASHWADYVWQEVLNKPSSIQLALWPSVPSPNPHLTSAREYVRSTSSSITSAEAAQLKKKEKGKSIAFDPKLPKKLTVFTAKSYPSWQSKYIEMVRQSFDRASLTLNERDLSPRIPKAEMKKAMPFIQTLKRRLVAGEPGETVFERKLAYDELHVLTQMRPGLKKTTGCVELDIVAVDDGAKSGVLLDETGTGTGTGTGHAGGTRLETLPAAAESAVPGTPSFHFENVKA